MLPHVTIIGRPNVGKSSIFNALSGHKIAIVSDIENTTRDIIEYAIDDVEYEISYTLADSGGIVQADDETLLSDVRERADRAISSSDLILFVLEYDRITEFDEFIVKNFVDLISLLLLLQIKQIIQNVRLRLLIFLNLVLAILFLSVLFRIEVSRSQRKSCCRT